MLKLRPVFSYTDPKVIEHVDVCITSLALHRIFEKELKKAGITLSPSACLEILSTCHLNQFRPSPGGPTYYSVTETTLAQQEILEALNLSYLVDDNSVSKFIKPRFVPM